MPTPRLIDGECVAEMNQMEPVQFHACITDPPYSLGFMGASWDKTGVANNPETWQAVLRVLRPGAHLVAFGGTRTWHRMVCAIEDAGFEIRDTLMWVYGQGMPHGADVSKVIDKLQGNPRAVVGTKLGIAGYSLAPNDTALHNRHAYGKGWDAQGECDVTAPGSENSARWQGWATALKPAWEPIVLARKPLEGTLAANTLKWGCGGLNIDACRVPPGVAEQTERIVVHGASRNSDTGQKWGTDRVAGATTLAVNPAGRWPANVVHDGSEEVVGLFPESAGQCGDLRDQTSRRASRGIYGDLPPAVEHHPRGDSGSAARFFYCAKVARSERGDSRHPTIKPAALMSWLIKLVCPRDGILIDPFAGSGTTGIAASANGMDSVLIEQNPEYCADIRRRCGIG